MAAKTNAPNTSPAKDGESSVAKTPAPADPNSVQRARPRQRKAAAVDATSTPRASASRRKAEENSIRPSRPRNVSREDRPIGESDVQPSVGRNGSNSNSSKRASTTPSGAIPAAAPEAVGDAQAMPEHIRRKFVQVGRKYYFPDGARAFTDRGRRLTTPSENTEVIRSLVTIAQARGWSEISVRGTERFRREAWFAARLAGLEVRGYRPSEFEQGRLIRTLARQSAAPASAPATGIASSRDSVTAESDARRSSRQDQVQGPRGVLAGKLIDHGRATYHHDPHEPMSYFVKIETPRGERVIWGVDLERSFKESLTQPQPGDSVGLRAVRQDAVKVKTPRRDPQGQVIGEQDLETHRNRWIVEKRDFFESRAEAARTVRDTTIDPKQAVKQHPELVGTYLQVRAAQLAARQFRNPEDQQQFVAQVRSALADSVARGEPLPPVRLRERSAERSRDRRGRETAPARG